MKKLLWALFILLALALLVAGGGLWYLRSAEPEYDQDAVLDGLSAPVEIWRDSMGVPHIWAASEADLFRALGHVHAQDRLWQMELFRRVADGRMAEMLGPDLVETDRFLRTLGLGRAAARQEGTLDAESRRLLEAYVAGVNAWIDGHGGSLPPEFVALRFEPEPWTVRNSLSIAKIMAWDLADWTEGLDLQRAFDLVGPELGRELIPRYPDWGVIVIPGARSGAVSSTLPDLNADGHRTRQPTPIRHYPRVPNLAAHLLDAGSIARASNSWVVAGSRTRSGKPILANDPHLALRSPSLWHLAALHGGEVEAAGATIPGVPAVVLGHTRSVAWGFTNAMVDDVDFFVERLRPEDPSLYLTPDGWRPLVVRAETIRVMGETSVAHHVRATRHGPVFSDVEDRGGARVLAMRWTAHEPSTTFRALIAMNRARTADELIAAIRFFDDPHQNVVFADSHGTIGYWMSGRVPIRTSGDGLLPVPGWTGEGDWTGYLDWSTHPHVLDPAEGFIVTANNRPFGDGYGFHIGQSWAEPFRAMRIRQMIEGESDLTAADVAAQQMDTRDAFALRYLPYAVRAAEAAGDPGAVALLRSWTGEAATDSRAAAVFYTWYESLRRQIGSDEYRGETAYLPRHAVNRILDAGASKWVDDVGTPQRETLEDISIAAMTEALRIVRRRTWGEIHTTRLPHALGAARILERTLDLDIGPFASAGSPYTVNVSGYAEERPPFQNSYGPSLRHVVDLGEPEAGGFVIPTGQSGLAFSRHYRDQTPLWREGRLWRIPLLRADASARAVHRQTLRPRLGG